jgi:predicted metal-binding membrane protein
MESSTFLARLPAASRWLPVLLVAAAAASWAVTGLRMAGMSSEPWMDPGPVGFYIGVWVVMMAAMMLPSTVPMTAMYDRMRLARRERDAGAPADATALFVAGYLVAWTAAGVVAYTLLALARGQDGAGLDWSGTGHALAGAVILLAAAWQLTPLKASCLRRCRGPLSFLMRNWRDGRAGALRLGVVHGGWCLGCCWALMLLLFAVGIMSLGWMALVAALIAFEKLWPHQRVATFTVAAVLLVLGVAVLAAPKAVPGLAVPGEHAPAGMHLD